MKYSLPLLTSVLALASLGVQAQVALPQQGAALSGQLKPRVAAAPKATVRTAGKTAEPVRKPKIWAYADDGCKEVDKLGELQTLLSEDFSLMTAGSEAEPDLSVQLDIPAYLTDGSGNMVENPDFQYPWNNMKPQYVHGDLRWGIGNAYPAGGMVYFPFSRNNSEAAIILPMMDLTANGGTYVLEFRAKLQNEVPATALMSPIIQVAAAETHNWAPSWDDVDEPFVVTDPTTQWRTYRFVFQGGGPSTLTEIVGMGSEGGMFVDDVKLYSLKPYLAAPVLRRQSDFTGDSFRLNWSAVSGAEKYNVNVWSYTEEGELVYLVQNGEAASNSYKVENADPNTIYYFTATAVGGGRTSVTPIARMVYDVAMPKMRKAEAVGESGYDFRGGVEPVPGAYGYSYMAMSKRVAEADGPFVITNETFTGWRHPLFEGDDTEYTKENPFLEGVCPLYYPTDLRQQGWYGDNFLPYKDYIALAPFFYTAGGNEQSCWVSPEFDLSKDGGKISIDLKLAATYWEEYDRFADCVVALFNYDEEAGDYVQVESVYCTDLAFDWKDYHVDLTKGSSRSVIGFFGINSFEDMYIDDIVIKQNYKKGESFMDPFYYRTWQLAEVADDPTTFDFRVPYYASGNEVYQKAQSARFTSRGEREAPLTVLSPFAAPDYVGKTEFDTGINFVENTLAADVKVAGGVITVQNTAGDEVLVANAAGQTVSLGRNTTVTYRPGVRGTYVVSVGKRSVKVVL